MGPDEASGSKPSRLSWSETGLAQESQSWAAIWLMDDTASRVISDEAIDDIGPVTFAISHQRVVTKLKIVHCIIYFKSSIKIKFPAGTPQRSSDRRSGRRACAVRRSVRSRSTAAGRKHGARSRAPATANHSPHTPRNAGGGADAACLGAAWALPRASRLLNTHAQPRYRGEAQASSRATLPLGPDRTTCRPPGRYRC